MPKVFISFAVLVGLFVGACGGGGESDIGGDGCNGLDLKIFNGEECSQSKRSAVVALFPIASDGNQYYDAGICTGTLVTVDDILTSAHCFTAPLQSGAPIVGFLVVAGGDVFEISNVAVHPSYDGAAGSRYDIAMATLARIPNPAIGPVPILVSRATKIGERASSFGYGTNNLGEYGVLKSAEFTIDGFVDGNVIATLETSGASICQGDSGGPLIQVHDGVSTLVGVNSFVTTTSAQCAASGSPRSGFVDLQDISILDFIVTYAPDVAGY